MGSVSNNVAQPQPPYGIILGALKSGHVIPFLGAGASLLQEPNGGPVLLSGSALSEYLAQKSNFPSADQHDRTDLAKVSSYYVDVSSRMLLRQDLRGKFVNPAYKSNQLHRLLAAVANQTTIVTTNYDTLLEDAFTEIGKPYDVVFSPADNDEYANGVMWWHHGNPEPEKLKANQIDPSDLGKTNMIYKMHGTVRRSEEAWDSFVITEEDYITFLSRINNAVPAAVLRYFSTRQFLFLGYGLRDWNLRVLLNRVTLSRDDVSWAIMKNPASFEWTLWNRRNVTLYDLELADFVARMEEEMNR